MNPKLISALLAVLLGGFFMSAAQAQIAPVYLPSGCGTGKITSSLSYLTVDATGSLCTGLSVNGAAVGPANPLPVTGTFSATLSGFTPGGTFATLTAAATSGSVALPAGTTVAFQNTGTTTVSCTLGIGSATALANEIQVPASSTVFVTVGSNTFGACIDQTGSTSNLVVLAGGSGLGTGFGGGGGSGGGGGAITAASGSYASGAFSAGAFANGADPVEGTITTAHGCNIAGYTVIGCLGQIDDDVKGPIAAGTNTIGTVGQLPYPVGAVPITASATGTTAATTATLAGAAGKTTYVCGYSIRANATANTNVTNTLTGVISGTMSSAMWVPANTAGLGVDEQIFSPCIPASATNTAIAAVSGAPGTGGVVTVKAWGFQL